MVFKNIQAIMLAAGRSKRFQQKKSKLLAKICGRTMLLFPVKILKNLGIDITFVLGHQAEEIKQEISDAGIYDVHYALQDQPLGTGHAVLSSQKEWKKEDLLILNADVPLVTQDLLTCLIEKHQSNNATITFVTTHALNPAGYGRVIEKDGLVAIYEEKDCPEEYRDSTKVNAGIYLIKKSFLQAHLAELGESPVTGELYLTDVVEQASKQGLVVQTIPAPFDETRGVNTLQELWAVEQIMRSNKIKELMNSGVRFELAQSIHIDVDVQVGQGSYIGSGVHLFGKTKIGQNCKIAAFSILENTFVDDGTVIHSHSVIYDSAIGKTSQVGPFARLRSNAIIHDSVNVGNFVEIKNSTIGESSKVKHLSYVGDTTMGKEVNVGAGTIICNYDGQKKHKTIIEDSVFVGSNNTLVAPVTINKEAYLAAGSTITKDVSSGDLAIARSRQENKKGYVQKLKKKEFVKSHNKLNFIGAVKTKDHSIDRVLIKSSTKKTSKESA